MTLSNLKHTWCNSVTVINSHMVLNDNNVNLQHTEQMLKKCHKHTKEKEGMSQWIACLPIIQVAQVRIP